MTPPDPRPPSDPLPEPEATREATAALRRPWWPYALLLGALAGLVVLWLTLRPGGPSEAPVEAAAVALDPDGMPYYDAGLAPFAVQIRDVLIPYAVFALYALPGETVDLRAIDPDQPGAPLAGFEAEATGGGLAERGDGTWAWTAPREPGLYPIRIAGDDGSVTLQAFVKRPYRRGDGALNGYRIGDYPPDPYQGNPLYNPPDGFVEVTPDLVEARLSPHFRLGQFLCKQESGWPKYVLVDPRLLVLLERLLEEVNRDSILADDFHVMSAYRTPFYNAAIGNTTTYSAHLYGLAADIFVDEDADQYMDDLTGDGAVDVEDARVLLETAEGLDHEAPYFELEGGLGLYGPAPHRGPFLHVDVRGERVRWGP